MRWWLRVLLTLVLAPLLWRLVDAYILNQEGTSWSDLAAQSVPLLGKVYITFTLPALVLCGGILTLTDIGLNRIGLDLLTVIVSPLLATALALTVIHLVQDPRVQAAQGVTILAVAYGLVWGLTIREPSPRRRPSRKAAEADVAPSSLRASNR